jgi:hypothetical protein
MTKKEVFLLLAFMVAVLMIGSAEHEPGGAQAFAQEHGEQVGSQKGGRESNQMGRCSKADVSDKPSADTGSQLRKTGRLSVETDPKNARVRVLNIRPKFYQGMELKPGSKESRPRGPGFDLPPEGAS